MKRQYLLMLAGAALSLTACDQVKFPGTGAKKESVSRPLPPPPGGAQTQVGETPAGATDTTFPAPETPLRVPEPTAPDLSQPDPGTLSAPDISATSPLAQIDNLLSINAMRCAPTTEEESLTLAELTGARAASANLTVQAVNASPISAAAFPGIVKMEPKRTLDNGGISSGHCSATRIARNWFVTATHCLDDTYDEIDLIVTASNLRDPRAIRVQASASLCHAAYGGAPGQYSNDVALIGISDDAAEAIGSVPVARYGATDRPLGATNYPVARMAGWGLTSFDKGELSNELLSAQLTLVSSGPALITVASRENSGPCIGDSGGPLLIDEADGAPKVIGVLSVVEQNRQTGEFCKGDYNARYTNLQGYTGWIESVIGVCTQSPELCAR